MRFAFGVNGDEPAHARGAFHSLAQGGVVRARKIIDAAVRHERFETNDAAFGEALEFARDCAARGRPRARSRSADCSCAAATFKSKLATSHVGGCALSGMSKKHVPPPAARALGTGFDAFPIRAAGFVEMDVRIDDAREKCAGCARQFPLLPNPEDLFRARRFFLRRCRCQIGSRPRAVMSVPPRRMVSKSLIRKIQRRS